MQNDDKLLTLKEVTARLKISRSTVLRMIAREEIHAYKVGQGLRFYEKDVKAIIRAVDVSEARNRVEPIDIESS